MTFLAVLIIDHRTARVLARGSRDVCELAASRRGGEVVVVAVGA